MESVGKDVPAMLKYLTEINGKVEQVKDHVTLLYHHTQSEECSSGGVDLLELKNQLLLSYVINLSHLIRIKSCNIHQCSPAIKEPVDRLVELRTVLEKMRSLEHKFSYQLDKLLRTAATSTSTGGDHPLQFKPVPNNLIPKLSEEATCDDESDGLVEEEGMSGLYVPPRVMAMPYKPDQKEMKSFPKSQPEKNQLMSELRDELSEFPSEVQTFGEHVRKRKMRDDDKSKESYEEEYMMRLATRKKPRDGGRVSREQLDELTDFSLFKGLSRTRKKRSKNSRMIN